MFPEKILLTLHLDIVRAKATTIIECMSSPSITPVLTPSIRLFASAFAVLLTLSACGGGGGGSSTSASAPVATNPGSTTTTPAADPIPADYMSYRNLCAAPRTGADAEGVPFPDHQGTLQDEMKFLRGWADSTYLWYKEVPEIGRAHV